PAVRIPRGDDARDVEGCGRKSAPITGEPDELRELQESSQRDAKHVVEVVHRYADVLLRGGNPVSQQPPKHGTLLDAMSRAEPHPRPLPEAGRGVLSSPLPLYATRWRLRSSTPPSPPPPP